MANVPFQRQSPINTKQLMASLIEAREQYSIYLRGVATGQRQSDSAEQEILKMKCDETVRAWRAGHEACRLTKYSLINSEKVHPGEENTQSINQVETRQNKIIETELMHSMG